MRELTGEKRKRASEKKGSEGKGEQETGKEIERDTY